MIGNRRDLNVISGTRDNSDLKDFVTMHFDIFFKSAISLYNKDKVNALERFCLKWISFGTSKQSLKKKSKLFDMVNIIVRFKNHTGYDRHS